MPVGSAASPKVRIQSVKDRKGYRVYRGKAYLGFATTLKEARAKGKDNAIQGSELSSGPRSPLMQFKHVRKKCFKGKVRDSAVVRMQGSREKTYLGSADTMAGAAALAADFLHTTVGDISRDKPRREDPGKSCTRVKVLLNAFEGWVPADLASAVETRATSGEMQLQAPAIYVASLFGKEHAWRTALATVWAHLPVAERLQISMLGARDPGARARAARIVHGVFAVSFGLWAGWSVPRLGHMSWPVDTARELEPPTAERQREATAEHAWWNTHVNKNVQNHLGLCPWGLRIGVLSKGGKSGSLLIKTEDGQYYSICPFDAHKHPDRISNLHCMGLVLNTLPVPQTSSEWIDAVRKAHRGAVHFNITASPYHWPWLVRLYLIVEMRHRGITRLRVNQDWGWEETAEATQPDQCKWIQYWMTTVASNSIKKLMNVLAYREPLELLSCFACIFGDNSIMCVTEADVTKSTDRIRRIRRRCRKESGRESHPAYVIKEACPKPKLPKVG